MSGSKFFLVEILAKTSEEAQLIANRLRGFFQKQGNQPEKTRYGYAVIGQADPAAVLRHPSVLGCTAVTAP